ncbi:unnamed protein product, partial [Mesorhabditis belari]|uniref:Acyl-CoA thioesterase-like C-terminal domain-containing protein n=1 Tax=Mesorhabditis belari TaxID=2138241 RepID=A0AAF3E8Y8_9BILA
MDPLPSRSEIANAVFSLSDFNGRIRASGPHIGGAFLERRLFGGQAVSQLYAAFRRRFSGETLSCISYKFVAPGSVSEPLDFDFERFGEMTRGYVYQKNKLIGIAFLRQNDIKALLEPRRAEHLTWVPEPEGMVQELSFLQQMGTGHREHIMRLLNITIFEMHIVEFGTKRMMFWGRVHSEVRDIVRENNGIDLVVMLSDYFIVQVASNHFLSFGLHLLAGASLNHTIHFHQSPQMLNVQGFYLLEIELESVAWNRAILRGHVYDRDLRLVLTVDQEAFASPQSISKSSKAKL